MIYERIQQADDASESLITTTCIEHAFWCYTTIMAIHLFSYNAFKSSTEQNITILHWRRTPLFSVDALTTAHITVTMKKAVNRPVNQIKTNAQN